MKWLGHFLLQPPSLGSGCGRASLPGNGRPLALRASPSCRVRTICRARAVCVALALLGAALAAGAQQAPKLGRTVHGVVQDALDRPLAGAVVYLKNARTKNIRSMITGPSGSYSFHQLQANTSYQVYAEWRGHKSKTRTDSEYEFSQDLRLDLQIPVA